MISFILQAFYSPRENDAPVETMPANVGGIPLLAQQLYVPSQPQTFILFIVIFDFRMAASSFWNMF